MPASANPPVAGGNDQALWYGPRVMRYLEELIEVVNTDTAVELKRKVPANARVVAYNLNWATAVGLATATKVGLGISGDPDSIALSAATLTKNHKTNGLSLTTAFVTSETTLRVSCVDNSGAAAGTFNATASIWVRVYYETFPAWQDAD